VIRTSFGTGTADPTTLIPHSGFTSANFWADVQVSDTAPSSGGGRESNPPAAQRAAHRF